ncbi:hypothetical protein [Pollutibacter soli]|uniref:hypothetical protein n=1 Tax=Pollutibacter soli TaxID=3034157 RepID=UPI0030140731
MKAVGLTLLGIVIGAFAGLMLGSGEAQKMNNTERNYFGGPAIMVCAFLGGVGGLVLGLKITQEEKDNKKFGFNTREDYEFKDGRGWGNETMWRSPEQNTLNVIVTRKEEGQLKTKFNGDFLINHPEKSAAKKVVDNLHRQAVSNIFTGIKKGTIVQK